MTRVPRLSIGLPGYNWEKYLSEALEACSAKATGTSS